MNYDEGKRPGFKFKHHDEFETKMKNIQKQNKKKLKERSGVQRNDTNE